MSGKSYDVDQQHGRIITTEVAGVRSGRTARPRLCDTERGRMNETVPAATFERSVDGGVTIEDFYRWKQKFSVEPPKLWTPYVKVSTVGEH